MAQGPEVLSALAAKLRGLGHVAEELAAVGAPALRKELEANIAAGKGPDGEPWKPTLQGKQPLQHAAKALTVDAVGTAIVATLTGPEALHDIGAARGHVQRRILPKGQLNAPVIAALEKAFVGRIQEVASAVG